jgi:hypothetical protein
MGSGLAAERLQGSSPKESLVKCGRRSAPVRRIALPAGPVSAEWIKMNSSGRSRSWHSLFFRQGFFDVSQSLRNRFKSKACCFRHRW